MFVLLLKYMASVLFILATCSLTVVVAEQASESDTSNLRAAIASRVTVSDVDLASSCPNGCLFTPPTGHVYYYDATTKKVCHIVHDADLPCYDSQIITLASAPKPPVTGVTVPDCPRQCAVRVTLPSNEFLGFIIKEGKVCRQNISDALEYCRTTTMSVRNYTSLPPKLTNTIPLCDSCMFADSETNIFSINNAGVVCHWKAYEEVHACGGDAEWKSRPRRSLPGRVKISANEFVTTELENVERCRGCDFGVFNYQANAYDIYRITNNKVCHYESPSEVMNCGEGENWSKFKLTSMPGGHTSKPCGGCILIAGSSWHLQKGNGRTCSWLSPATANACNLIEKRGWHSVVHASMPSNAGSDNQCPSCTVKKPGVYKYQNADICPAENAAPMINPNAYYYLIYDSLYITAQYGERMNQWSEYSRNMNGRKVIWRKDSKSESLSHWRFVSRFDMCSGCYELRSRSTGQGARIFNGEMETNFPRVDDHLFEIKCASGGYAQIRPRFVVDGWIRCNKGHGSRVLTYNAECSTFANLAVREIDSFTVADIMRPAVVNKNDAVEFLTTTFYDGMIAATDGIPLGGGALAAFGLRTLFNLDDMPTTLSKLKTDILATVGTMIEDAIIKSQIEQVVSEAQTARSQYLNDYLNGKKRSRAVPSSLSILENSMLSVYCINLEASMRNLKLFPLDGDVLGTDDKTVKMAQGAFRSLKMFTVSLFNMYQEWVLLRAIQDMPSYPQFYPMQSCDDIYEWLDLWDKVGRYIKHFEDIQWLLLERRTKSIEARLYITGGMAAMCLGGQDWCDMYRTDVMDNNFLGRIFDHVTYYRAEGHRVLQDWSVPIRDLHKAELEFDMKNLSYQVDDLKRFLNGFAQNTFQMCRLIRETSARGEKFRSDFINGYPAADLVNAL